MGIQVAKGFFSRFRPGRKRENPFARLSRDLLEFSRSFSSITDMNQLVPSIIGKMRDLMGIRTAALFLLNSSTGNFDLAHSRDIDLKPHLRLRGSYHFSSNDKLPRWLLTNREPFVMSRMREVFGFLEEEERDILRFVNTELCLPLEAHNRFIGMLCLGPRHDGTAFSSEDVQLLVAITAQAALAMENHRLQREALERERFRRELEIAGELQRSLLPDNPPRQYPGLEITGSCLPCTEVGGDYYDYLPISDDDLAVVIGDVAGHGMSAGLLMGMAKSCVSTAVKIDASCRKVMSTLNSMIYDLGRRRSMMTFLYSILDSKNRTLTFCNAGHIFPYVYRCSDDTIRSVEAPAYPLGIRPEYELPEHNLTLGSGDFVLFCSDGFPEAMNKRGEQYGFERLEQSIKKHRSKDAKGLSEGVKSDFFSFLSGFAHQDDLTLVVISIRE